MQIFQRDGLCETYRVYDQEAYSETHASHVIPTEGRNLVLVKEDSTWAATRSFGLRPQDDRLREFLHLRIPSDGMAILRGNTGDFLHFFWFGYGFQTGHEHCRCY
jgi:hypothetical protein